MRYAINRRTMGRSISIIADTGPRNRSAPPASTRQLTSAKSCIAPTYSSSLPGKSIFALPMLYVRFKEQNTTKSEYHDVKMEAIP